MPVFYYEYSLLSRAKSENRSREGPASRNGLGKELGCGNGAHPGHFFLLRLTSSRYSENDTSRST